MRSAVRAPERFESCPVRSTPREPSTTIGAHEFRNHFGWYMERAAAGEEIVITCRGKAYVRLTADQAVSLL